MSALYSLWSEGIIYARGNKYQRRAHSTESALTNVATQSGLRHGQAHYPVQLTPTFENLNSNIQGAPSHGLVIHPATCLSTVPHQGTGLSVSPSGGSSLIHCGMGLSFIG